MSEIVAVDIGGTHARFAIASIGSGIALGEVCTLRTSDHAAFETAWEEFARRAGRPLPPAAAIAVAGPAQGDMLKLTNNSWVLRPAELCGRLGLRQHLIVNDFGAIAHAVARLGEADFIPLCGPASPLPEEGVISIVGPGTGLGVAQLIRTSGAYQVVETEGGHVDFAPLDPIEDRMLARLRPRHRRVSAERIASGPGLLNIYEALAEMEGGPPRHRDDEALWKAALSGEDSLAVAALDRFCLALGAIAGDMALAQGAVAVVVAGGLGLRLAQILPRSGFRERFIAKGRFERRMDEMPVKIVTHPQPGLYGAAAAFAQGFGR